MLSMTQRFGGPKSHPSRRNRGHHALLTGCERLEGRTLLSADPGWVVQGASTGHAVGRAVALDGANNAYVAGYFSGSLDLSGDGSADLTSMGGTQDGYVSKYAPDGVFLWATRI